jgi:arylsulfatase A-like enzyme
MNGLSMRILSLGILLGLCTAVHAQQRPNIILIMADDMGYSDLGSYGGEVQTPNLDQLAKEGIKYKQFYNGARCCPTRAALMTGISPHEAGMGWMAAADLGTPAGQGNLNNNCVTIAEVLKTAGYDTYMTGKWHLTNERKIDGEVKDNWPRQRGFDHYFGIIPGGANYYTPMLYSNNEKYPAPKDFYLTTAISDTSVKYIDHHFNTKPNDPMFMYVAYTAPHWPLHALQKDIDKYKEIYKAGWDKMRKARYDKQKQLGLFAAHTPLSPRDAEIPDWDQLPEAKKTEMAMRMAIYAAQIDVMDDGIGKIVQTLKQKGQLDNTLIFFLSDNGACAEFISSGASKEVNGQQNTFESYRINWANVSSTPFKEYKHYTYEGGIATPLIVHWPKGIDPKLNNRFISDYGHINDIMATCVEVGKTTYPSTYKNNKIVPLAGKSLLPHFTGKTNDRGAIYWEHEANIAMREGKWKLVAKTPEDASFSEKSLQLFDMEADPTEMKDLAKGNPELVGKMYKQWLKWANKVGAFPMDTRNYNQRAEVYKKNLNGEFDDNLGSWAVKKGDEVEGEIEIDRNGKISGANSVHITMKKPADKPAGLSLTWRLKANKGEKYKLELAALANKSTSFVLRFEKPNGAVKLLDQDIQLSAKTTEVSSATFEVPEDGPYVVALYFGKLNKDDQVWADRIKLVPVK